MRKTFLEGILMGAISLIIGVSPVVPRVAYALTEAQLNEFAQNNILFYDPEGGKIKCYAGNLTGDTVMAKIVNYLSGNNPTGFVLSQNGIAGILANFEGESGFNPFRYQYDSASGPGYGIAQFTPMSKIFDQLMSDPRTSSYYNDYVGIEYTYYDSNTGYPTKEVPMDVINAWLEVQLDYFFGGSSEFETVKVSDYRNVGGTMGLDYLSGSMTVHEAMDAAQSAGDAARIFVWLMERPADKATAASLRSAAAAKWLTYVQSVGPAGSNAASGMRKVDGSKVTVIGDSITVASTAALQAAMPGVDIHAQVSKQFYEGTSDNPGGIAILRDLVSSNSLRDTLVYALGTNGSFTLEQAQAVVDLAGPSRKVIFVNNYTADNDYLTNNNALAKVKNDNPSNVSVADWKGAIESQMETYLESDGIHPSAAGQELFASIVKSMIGDAESMVTACSSGAVDGGLSESQAQALADYYNGNEVDADYWGLPYGKMNCVSLSAFFIQRFTSIGRQVPRTWGDGREVAHNLAQTEGLPSGTAPRPYAIFSVTQGVTMCEDGYLCGHTGVVVAVDGDELITVEAAYKAHDAIVQHRTLDYFVNEKYGDTFVYLDSILDEEELAQVLGS